MRKKVANQYSIEQICMVFGNSRQAYYQRHAHLRVVKAKEHAILEATRQIRIRHPRMGTRKLLDRFNADKTMTAKLGRDKLFKLLGKNDLLVKPKRKQRQTTQSRNSIRLYENLVAQAPPTKPNQAWGVDFTYLRTLAGFIYLAIVIDWYSRKIIGFALSRNIDTALAKEALMMALRQVDDPKDIFHHSDNGSQYDAEEYRKQLINLGMRISRAAKGKPYENAITERAIGILKDEYAMDSTFTNDDVAIKVTSQAIYLYNHERPHTSLGYKTPQQIHLAA